jgi:transposase-like protein
MNIKRSSESSTRTIIKAWGNQIVTIKSNKNTEKPPILLIQYSSCLFTRAEKEKRVIDMYEQGATYRAIAKEVHISPGNISAILRRHTGELQVKSEPENVEQQKQNQQDQELEQTIDTKVFKLFEEGKTPVEVAIDLNLPSGEVTRLQREYWALKGLPKLERLYKEIGGDHIFDFHHVYLLIKNEGFTPQRLIEAAEYRDELPNLRSEHELLKQENQILEDQKVRLDKEIIDAKQELIHINSGIDFNREAIKQLQRQKFHVQAALASLNTGAGYQHLVRTAEDIIKGILEQNQAVLVAALCALLKALREEPKSKLHLLVFGFTK